MTKLSTYMTENKIKDAEFASLVGRDRTIVNKWRNGKLAPTLDDAAKIEQVTSGHVPMKCWVTQP
jgi:transcriptional regulator with XRE-family HTH domain